MSDDQTALTPEDVEALRADRMTTARSAFSRVEQLAASHERLWDELAREREATEGYRREADERTGEVEDLRGQVRELREEREDYRAALERLAAAAEEIRGYYGIEGDEDVHANYDDAHSELQLAAIQAREALVGLPER